MSDEVHAERREPEQPEGAVDLVAEARAVLEQAAVLAAGRSARTLTPGAGAPLTQTLMAITAGRQLHEHQAPGPATLQVLIGEVTLRTGDDELHLRQHQWARIPDEPHDLHADSDAVVLLTVALPRA